MQLQEVWAENIGPACEVYCMCAVKGKVNAEYPLKLIDRDGTSAHYGSVAVGTNISLRFKGTFRLTSLVLSFNIHGER